MPVKETSQLNLNMGARDAWWYSISQFLRRVYFSVHPDLPASNPQAECGGRGGDEVEGLHDGQPL